MKRAEIIIQIFFLILCFIFLTGFAYIQGYSNGMTGYAMYINDVEVGVIRYAAKGLSIYDEVIAEIRERYDEQQIYIEADVYFKERYVYYGQLTGEAELARAIREVIEVKADAFAIVIDDNAVCFVKTYQEAEEVLERVKLSYQKTVQQMENTVLEDIDFKENVKIEPQTVLYSRIVDVDRAVQVITTGTEDIREYEVKKGDTLWNIARQFNMHVADIQAANPDLDSETIRPGQKIKLQDVVSLITVVTLEKKTYTQPIPFDTVIKDSSDLYKGEKRVSQKGQNGEKQIEVYITRENGVEVSREKVGETVLKQPVDQIELRGTKNRPVVSSSTRNYTRPTDLTPISRNGVEMTPWFGGADKIFTRGSIAKVTHVATGLTFYVKRRGGTNHADCEPLTAEDTAVIRRIYGGKFSWEREAIIVQVNGKKMAASMNSMPHGGYTIKDNNFRGHLCIHFYGSRTHGTNKVDPDHQAMVRLAAGL
jgi:LysM repeat protein